MNHAAFVYLAGLAQAVFIAVAAYLTQPNDLTGRPLAIAIIGVVVSAAVTYVAARQTNVAARREVERARTERKAA